MNITSVAGSAQKKKWTVLYYMDGKNNLESMVKRSFNTLDKVGSDDNVNLVAELGLGDKAVLRGQIQKGQGTEQFRNLGSVDMGSARSVQDFVEWGMKNYPAERYAVVLSNHGAGFKGILTDDEYGSVVENEDLAQALESAQSKMKSRIDVISMDACLMAQAEVGYALRNSADYLVASEETEAGLALPIPGLHGGSPLDEVARDLQEAGGNLDGEQLARLFVYEAGRQVGRSMFTPTQSAIDLKQMGALRDSTENLATSLLQAIRKDPAVADRLRSTIGKTQNFSEGAGRIEPYVDYRDLGDFCRRLGKEFKDLPAVNAAARAVEGTLASAVVAEHHTIENGGVSMFGSTGMSVYLPTDFGHDSTGISFLDGLGMGGTHEYEYTDFAKGSQWLKLLETISQEEQRGFSVPSGMLTRFVRTMGRYELPFVSAMAAGGGMGGIATVTALMAGFDSALRVQSGVGKLAQAAESGFIKGTTGLVAQGLMETALGAANGVAAGALLLGAPQTAMMLSLGTIGVDLAWNGAKLGASLLGRVVDATRSVEDKLEATEKSRFQPALTAFEQTPEQAAIAA